MKRLFVLLSILTSFNALALVQKAYFPEVTGQITSITSEKDIEIDDLEIEYIISCSGHKTPSISGYDNGIILTDCNDDSLSYEIGLREDGTFDLPEVNEFSLEGKAFACYLVVNAPDFSTEHGFTYSSYHNIPCSNATNEEIKESLKIIKDLKINL